MKILHITDLHFHKQWFQWLETQVPNVDLICISGDFIDLFRDWEISPASQARWIVKWLEKLQGKVAVCSGNHDWWEASPHHPDPSAYGKWLICQGVSDNQTRDFGEFQIFCKPWIGGSLPSFRKPALILTHGPRLDSPLAVGIDGDNGDPEFDLLLGKLPRGSMVFSGHVHTPQDWYEAWNGVHCFNPGMAIPTAATPNFIFIDTIAKTAKHFGRDVEVIRLASL